MITPRSPSGFGSLRAIDAAASRITLNVPIRLMRMTVSNTSSGCGPFLLVVRSAIAMPAQLTRICSEPKRSWVALNGFADFFFAGDVGGDGDGVLAQRGGKFQRAILIAIQHDDIRALLGEALGGRCA